MRDEWENDIKENVLKRLNNVFPEKKFKYRFKPTDNANDNTFWPFWISLYEDENILEVAVRATIIIRDEYKKHLEGNDYKRDEICNYYLNNVSVNNTEVRSKTRFTIESWEKLRTPWLNSDDNQWASLLDKFIYGAVKEKLLEEGIDGYEKAFKFLGSNTSFAVMLQLLVNRVNNEHEVPWEKIENVFFDKKGNVFSTESLKSINSRHWARYKEKHGKFFTPNNLEQRRKREKSPLFNDKYLRQFLKIMDAE